MRRAIASLSTWWLRLFVVLIIGSLLFPVPAPWNSLLIVAFFLLFLVRPPQPDVDCTDVCAPVGGRWVAINSPGTATPSHGVKAYGQMYAVDIVRPTQAGPTKMGWGLRGTRPEAYPAFGEDVLAMAAGRVVRAKGGRRDQRACDSWPRLAWMLTFGGFLRELAGMPAILGNHVIVRHEDGTFAVYAHLRRSSPTVTVGDTVQAGHVIGLVGNTGNTSEPHLHAQLMDRERPTAAAGLPMRWTDITVHPDEYDSRWGRKEPKASALPDFPTTGQIFHADQAQTS